MTVGERIKLRRKELGLTVDELADKLGKNRATIYRYESSEIEKLPTTILEPLSIALGVTPAYLMGWEEPQYGNIIRETRVAQGLDIMQLSEMTGISMVTLGKYEHNEIQPNLEDLYKIASAFGFSIGELLWKNFRSEVELMDQFANENNSSLAYLYSSGKLKEYVIKKLMIYFTKQNITDTKIAEYLNISETEVAQWKTGRNDSYMNYLPKLAELVGAPLTEFLVDGIRNDGRSKEEIIDEELKQYLFGDGNIPDELIEDVKRYAKIVKKMWEEKQNTDS